MNEKIMKEGFPSTVRPQLGNANSFKFGKIKDSAE